MPSASSQTKKTGGLKKRPKAVPKSNIEIFQQIIADQNFIREAIQSGVTFHELKDKHGYKFTTV